MKREEAIDILKAIQALICPNKESVLENNFSEAFDTAIEALQDKSSGEWERLIEYMPESDEGLITFDGYRCSVCGVKVFVDEFRAWDYCPNCGAMMENKE